jgi:hemoglobin
MDIPITIASDVTFDEAHVAVLVDRFYDKVRADPMLGPVFNAIVDDWDEHKRLLTSFWATVALRTGSYRGNPMAKHRPLPIGRQHFERWLALWRETTVEVLDQQSSILMAGYAERIGRGLRMGMGLGDRPRAHELGISLRTVPPAP